MNARKLIGILSAAASAATLTSYFRYRKEMRALRRNVDAGSTIAETNAGEIEYADSAEGEPALVIHGAGGGYDQGILIGRDLGPAFRVIAPSRFGYLKTPVPRNSSPTAQADAHAALLDFLDIRKTIVLAASAGAPSAIELALRHPERVSALILLVPRTYHPTQQIGADQSAPSQAILRLIENSADFTFWLAMHIARGAVVRFFGVPPEVEANAPEEERARVTELIRSVLPLSGRVAGIAVDGAAEIKPWPLGEIKVPTLIISAQDDLYKTLSGARFTAEQIPGAELHVLKSGGHLMVGQNQQVRILISDFLSRHRGSKSKHARPVAKMLEPVS